MEIPTEGAAKAKYLSAAKAMEFVKPGMKLGLGTGSTAAFFVDLLGEKVAEGLDVLCVPTSSVTKAQAEALGIPLTTLGEIRELDLVIDGADEFDGRMNLIKGGGGALLQEKLVATAAKKMIVISDDSKKVKTLGAFPLPVEVVRFGWETTQDKILKIISSAFVGGVDITRRMAGDEPFVTDEGHYILDLHLKKIDEPPVLAEQLKHVVGVVETGFFIDIAKVVIIGKQDGTTRVIDSRPAFRPVH